MKTLKQIVDSIVENLQVNGEALEESLRDWAKKHEDQGCKITKDNKTGTYHAWKGNKHVDSYKAGNDTKTTRMDEAAQHDIELKPHPGSMTKRLTRTGLLPTKYIVHAVNHPEIKPDQLRPGEVISDTDAEDLKDVGYKVGVRRGGIVHTI